MLVVFEPPIAWSRDTSEALFHEMPDIPTKKLTYTFPLDTMTLKYRETGGRITAQIEQLTKFRSYYWVDRHWWNFRGPFVKNCREPEDRHWKWHRIVRRLRKNPWVRCAAVRTPDKSTQGAIVYRRDGASLLESNTGAVYIEYLAVAPQNRRDYALQPLYLGVGEGLLTLAILHSYEWNLGGRVALFSLPRSLGFYKKYDFVETGYQESRMIHCELPSESAVNYLEERGLIE